MEKLRHAFLLLFRNASKRQNTTPFLSTLPQLSLNSPSTLPRPSTAKMNKTSWACKCLCLCTVTV
ncbi:hypothetical protein ASPWEDRAFT_514458 [Aspergillus wentii DTO 134E9]|uniref:Uncharacterized protein n=1 Tax=Aspergillus wentii DTO 134E9 TaxID=1073089 RepID=A0A1L9RKU5_ASPWE|nr:uncharacterized protein ASPWEDRAFT_514458 [Aspergillus wentii DTO 134E9]OJJ35542.1 hypothetical protein ASPWEDRAFT_514458 [Aspergillus wentii DTO 134E9]